ncbi:glycosyltransferase family 9 protein [Salegentibacter sp. F14]
MKILIIQQKMIGDVLTSSILFEALRKKYPKAQLHYLVYPHTIKVIENNPFIDRIITYSPEEDGKPLAFLNFLRRIRREKYDIVIDVYSKIGSGLISKASGAPKRISYHKWYTAHFYSSTVNQGNAPQTRAGLAVENRMRLLQALDKDFPAQIKPKIYLREAEKTRAKDRLLKAGITPEKTLVMVGILGSSEEKTYPPQYMAKLLDELVKNTNAEILFNYIPRQKEQVETLFKLCNPRTQNRIHLEVFGNNLREFLALTAHCDALIGNEGGAINMAKALDIPSFAIYSPQINKEAWAIYEDKSNQSVHLKSFKPELFSDKKASPALYQDFTPDLISPVLLHYLKGIKLA